MTEAQRLLALAGASNSSAYRLAGLSLEELKNLSNKPPKPKTEADDSDDFMDLLPVFISTGLLF